MNADSPGEESRRLPPLPVAADCNYIGVFLTLHCNLRCSYCINRFGNLALPGKLLSAQEWIEGLNRLQAGADLPLTLQGGEPSLHPAFYEIINGIRPELNIDLLTNLQFDVDSFMERIPPSRLHRESPYASIRVSYHPETMDFQALKDKVRKLLRRGYSIGIWAVDHPAWSKEIDQARNICATLGIDFRVKEFLGYYQGSLHGTYADEQALGSRKNGPVECRTTELLIGPGGNLYRCHSDLYEGRTPQGHLLDPVSIQPAGFLRCDHFGTCNPCDVKIKTNRFQLYGHTSVAIRHRQP